MRDEFEKMGYYIVPEFLNPKHVDELNYEADCLANKHYVTILNIHTRIKSFYDLIMNQGILYLADKLQGHKMIPVGSIFFFCKPGSELENGSNFHQDNYAAKSSIGSYMTCGVALDDCDESNGALKVYEGSHKLGDLECEPSINFDKDESGKITKSYPVGNKVKTPENLYSTQLSYKKGSLVFIHSNLIHGCPKNPHPDKWRRTIYLNYIKDGHPFWPGWNAKRQILDRETTFEKI